MKLFFAAVIIFGSTLVVHSADTLPDDASVVKTTATVSPAALTVSSAPAETKAVAPAPAISSQTAPAAVKSLATLTPLQGLTTFHEKEIAALKQMRSRWDSKLRATMQRREDLEQDVQARSKKADELLQQDTKTAKREAGRLTKEIGRINKDIASIDKELRDQTKALAGEIKEESKEAQQALKDAYQQAITDIQKPQGE